MPRSLTVAVRFLCCCALATPGLLSLLPAQENPGLTLDRLFSESKQALELNRFQSAAEIALKILGTSLDQLGGLYTALDNYPLAEKAYTSAARVREGWEDPWQGLAILYLRMGEYEKGIEAALRLLGLNGSHPEGRHILGKLHLMRGDFTAASQELRRAYALNPGSASVAYTLALSELELKRPGEAQKIFGLLSGSRRGSASLHSFIGRLYLAAADSAHPSYTEYLDRSRDELLLACKLDPQIPLAHFEIGWGYLLKHGTEGFAPAIPEFQSELHHNPGHYLSNFFLGIGRLRNHENREAIVSLQRASELEPDKPDPWLYLGHAYFSLGEYSKAVPDLEKALALEKDAARNDVQAGKAHFLLGQSLLKLGNRSAAERHLKIAQDLKNSAYEAEGTVGKGVLESLDALSLNSNRKKTLVLEREPPTPGNKEKWERAAGYYRDAAARAYEILARLAAHNLQFSQVADYLAEAAFWNESLPGVYFNLGLAQSKIDRLEEAANSLKKSMERNPASADSKQLMAHLAWTLSEKRQPRLALVTADYLIAHNPEDPAFYLLRGRIYAQQADADRALGDFRSALEKNPSLPEAHYNAAIALIRQGRLDEALEELEQELRIGPEHPRALYHKAFVLISYRRDEEAIPLLERVIGLEPNYTDAYYQLGKALLEKDQVPRAVANLETAARLDPNQSYVFYQLSRAYTRSGRPEDSNKALERYRDLKVQEEKARLSGVPPN